MSVNNKIKFNNDINIDKNDIPYPLLYGSSRMEILGNKKIYFDGNYKIIEYSDDMLQIKRGKLSIVFKGSNLSICNVAKDSFVLTGKLSNISFE